MLPDDPDAQARLFYLSLLGAFIVVGVFARYRDRMGQAMQHMAIWALIFVGVVLAIGFADPLRQQLFNDEPQVVDENTVQLRQARDGHFYATLQVNGQPIQFLVDTGATSMVLTKEDAEAAGIDTGALNYVIRTQTANGESTAAPIKLNRVELGPHVDYEVRATVAGGDLNKSLLGMSYLENFSSFRREGNRLFIIR